MYLGRLAARAVIGSLFIGHGTQKLYGWFSGPGLAGTEGMMEALDMRPARRNAYAAGITETAGGALLVVGLATPLAAAGLIGTMITAIRKVHLPNGLWAANGGWEYNAMLITALLMLADDGPGDLSLDAVLGLDDSGPAWALGALVAGAAASTAAIELGRRTPAAMSAPVTSGNGVSPPLDVAGDPTTKDSTSISSR